MAVSLRGLLSLCLAFLLLSLALAQPSPSAADPIPSQADPSPQPVLPSPQPAPAPAPTTLATKCKATNKVDFCTWYNEQQVGNKTYGACCTKAQDAALQKVFQTLQNQNANFYDPDKGDCEDRLALLICKPCSVNYDAPTCTPFCDSIEIKCFPTAYISSMEKYNWALPASLGYPGNVFLEEDVGENERHFHEYGCDYCVNNVLGSNCTDVDHGVCFNSQPTLVAPVALLALLSAILCLL